VALKKQLISVFLSISIIFIVVDVNAFFDAKFEPPDGMIYHGAQAEVRPENTSKYSVDWMGIEEYTKACGKRPKLIMHYISFDERAFTLLKPAIYEISQKEYTYIPQIGLDFYDYSNNRGIMNPNDITQEIAQGKHDQQIKDLARLLREMKTPVFLRPGYEFGGTGQGSRASKTYWVKAWRKIHDIFQAENTHNVAFVWNTLDAGDFIDYYPGDTYVDWWAISVFENNADQNQFIDNFIQEAATHRKPVMIAESTPRYIGSIGGQYAWDNWYRPYFSLILKYSHIKAFCYINASWKAYPDTSFAFDCRIQSNKIVSAHYQKTLSSQRFVNATER
jgi:hypothetical protein